MSTAPEKAAYVRSAGNRSARLAGVIVLALGAVLLPLWNKGAAVDVVTLALLYGFLAASWNIVGGITGQLSMGHAAFFGLGAYGVGICYVQLGLSPYLGVLVGVGFASVAGAVLGALSFWLPFSGYTFILLTLSFAELMRHIVRTVAAFGGSDGLIFPFKPGIATLQFRNSIVYYFIALVMVVAVIAIGKKFRASAAGLRAEAVRDDEGAAVALGVASKRVKLMALIGSAALTGLGGAFYAVMFSFITPDQVFSIDFSVAMITGALIGGIGTAWGPVIGGAAMWLLTEGLARLPLGSGVGANIAVMLYGLLLILIVQRLPRGILPNLVGEHVRGRLDGGIALQRITGWWSNRARATRPSRQVADKADAKNR
jgi:branched-chain amino acid transport system permease protein